MSLVQLSLRWITEYLILPEEEGTLRVEIQTHPEKKRIKMRSLEIEGEEDIDFKRKLELYMKVVAELFAKEKGVLPSFQANNTQKLYIFYHLGFVSKRFKNDLKDNPPFMKVRSTFAENTVFPLELAPINGVYFKNWVNFQDPEFEGKNFGETILLIMI